MPPFDPRELLSGLTSGEIASLSAVLLAQDPLLSMYEAADYLGCSVQLLANWRLLEIGPATIKIHVGASPRRQSRGGGHERVRYRLSVLNAFIATRETLKTMRLKDEKLTTLSAADLRTILYAMGWTGDPLPIARKPLLVGEAARMLGVRPRTLRRWDASGHFKAVRDGSGRRTYDMFEVAPDGSVTTLEKPADSRPGHRNVAIDMTGKIIHGCTVLHREGTGEPVLWACLCKCGEPFTAQGNNLRRTSNANCGCENRGLFSKKRKPKPTAPSAP